MIVKVCGMRDSANIRDVEALGIDMMGMIFYQRSPRYVDSVPDYLPKACRRVGVFVNADLATIVQKITDYRLDLVQLHGSESPDLCGALRSCGVGVIKAFSVEDAASLSATAAYDGGVDYMLFDTPTAAYGGSGSQFDWTLLDAYHGSTPFLLSGGIGPDSAPAIAAIRHPRFAGIDLNSRFETAPALKSPSLLADFLTKLPQ